MENPIPNRTLSGWKRLACNPEAIVVENAPLGVQAGVAARIFTVAVNTGPLPDRVLLDAGADYLLPDMERLALRFEDLYIQLNM